jgi:hypothetical protein
MKNLQFSVFRRTNRPFYLVAFKNEATGEYYPAISTRQKTEAEAIKTAFVWLRDSIPQKRAVMKVEGLALKDTARKIKTKAEAETLLDEMKRMGWIKSYVLTESQAAQDFPAFLTGFWDWDKSAYIAEKRRKSHGIHRRYCNQQGRTAAMYWQPFFKGRILGDITAADVDAFITHIGNTPLSAGRKNTVILAGTKPL